MRELTTRGGEVASRLAHNQEIAGSSPAPATKKFLHGPNWAMRCKLKGTAG
ncbi:MAG: hypothetical protein UV47_C0042G0001 [Parcubacteria group bacterium GW2011_GWA2_42_80]|nr:MAG: hypothetical protein UV47_C0042G0001 [Parcubacteria group bacterium GW2011_GWA2_42_80]